MHEKRCPICARPVREDEALRRFRPFCSKRCADVDLLRWLNGSYAIPAAPNEDEGDDEASDSPRDAEEEAEEDEEGTERSLSTRH